MNATAVTPRMQHALTFETHEVRTITRDGQLWMSGQEVGRALEYASPEKAIANLYKAHADEFTGSMTRLFRVATAGGKQLIRFFSLRGAHLLGMFARTGKAKAFRIWVLDLLDCEAIVAKDRAQKYHYPLESCKPVPRNDGFDHQAQFDLMTLTDPRNPTPELKLLSQLERDGHDVTGARVRIIAMRQQLAFMLMTKNRLLVWEDRLKKMMQEFTAYGREQGVGALFGREPQGISRLTFCAQLPGWEKAEQETFKFARGIM